MKQQKKTLSIVALIILLLVGWYLYKKPAQSIKPLQITDQTSAPLTQPTNQISQINHSSIYDPLIVLTLMVKDEEHVIVQTLKPYVEGGIDAVLVFDTGSTDKTMQLAEHYLKSKNINFHIAQEPFIDFAASRNRGLEIARVKFPHAGFLLMPDAEWYLHNPSKLIAFCKEQLVYAQNGHTLVDTDSYLMRIMSTQLDFYTQRLMRADKPVKFVGVVHETLDRVSQIMVPTDVYFELGSTKQGYEKSKKRWQRDKELLLKHHKENPSDPRTAFYLAQTYDCLGELENASTYYKKRRSLLGWYEENFMTVYRLAQVTERLAAQNNKKNTWDEALGYYLEAFSMRPCRAEPLIKISQYYLNHGKHELAYLFARRAEEINYPASDVLFVEKEAYEYVRHDVLGQCAWYVQSYDLGEAAVKKALNFHPSYEHLNKNLAFYENRKKLAQATT